MALPKTGGGKTPKKSGNAIMKDVRKSGQAIGQASGQRATGSKKGC